VPYLKSWPTLLVLPFLTQGLQAESASYATVTDERLQHPEAGDWLMYRQTYDGSGFSPLRQITAANIGKLSLAD
jgi:alcohol dehydrogenase (cytochrome c)